MASVDGFPDFHFLPHHHHTAPADPALTLQHSASWTYCGPLLPDAYDELPPSFHTWANATVKGPLAPSLIPLLSRLHTFFYNADISHYWLTVRATKGSHDFDTPRWHTDDEFFKFPGDTGKEKRAKAQWKLTATLLGPGTLFIADGDDARQIQSGVKSRTVNEVGTHVCTSIRCLGCASTGELVRERLADALRGHTITQAPTGRCVFFRAGTNVGAIHSEPPSHGDRIFVNAIPGTEDELKTVLSKWGMEYPRSWSVGVPLQFDLEAGP